MTVLDRMPANDLADHIVAGPTGFSGVDGDEEWAAEVRRLADLRGATLLAHNYQLPAIQDVGGLLLRLGTFQGVNAVGVEHFPDCWMPSARRRSSLHVFDPQRDVGVFPRFLEFFADTHRFSGFALSPKSFG